MNDERKCTGCGAPLTTTDAHALCPACIFHRLLATGSTMPLNPTSARAASAPDDTDFDAEYELLTEIGRGGMGVIYKAHQPRLNRVVAVKVIHAAGAAGDAARRRFQSEVKVAARLNHPNIVPVFAVGVMEGLPCFSMEFFPGGNLAQRLGQPGSRLEDSVRLLIKVARAVDFAHQHGVLHRDLKPANILLDAAGEPHVADFGLAKQLDSNSDLTRSGAVIGSPNYMSPEQAAGRSNSLTVATDVYSLGVMLYQMLTGRTPFTAETPLETMRLVVETEPPRPSTIVLRADRDLETICLKCLEKEPERRYHTAAELADDLDRWRQHQPIQARPSTGFERLQKWARRRPALAALLVLFFLTFAFGVAGILWEWHQAEQARRSELRQLRRAEAALARSALSLAEAALREGNGPAVQAALESVPVALRDPTWSYLRAEADTSRLLPPIGIAKMDDLTADPSRPSVFAAADHSGRIVFFDVRDGSRRLEFTAGFDTVAREAVLRITVSPAGDRLAIGRTGPGGIVIHDPHNGRKLVEWPAPDSGRLEFSPDGQTLLQTSADRSTTRLWNTADGSPRWTLASGYHAAVFATDGRYVLSYSWTDQLRLLNAADGTPVRKLTDDYFEEFAAQPGSHLLVTANPLGFVRGINWEDGRLRFEFQAHESSIQRVAFLPGGERFLTAAALPDGRQALQCWDARNGRPCQSWGGGSGDLRLLSLHPLSGELIVAGRDVRVWEATGLAPVQIIRGSNAHPSAVFWGMDGLIFAPGPDDNGADLQSFAGASRTVLWRPADNSYGQPSVSADGRRAAIGRYNSGEAILVLERQGAGVSQIAALKPSGVLDYVRLSPTGDRLALVQRYFTEIQVVEVATARPAAGLDVQDIRRINDLAWLDGGKHLAGLVTTHAPRSAPGSREQVVLWDIATGRRERAATNSGVTSVACAAPDGRRFAEAGSDRNVRVRDAATLEVRREFRVHNAPVTALAWHPSRPILATASQDLVIRLWDVENGTRLEELRGPLSSPSVLSFSPDGTRLATAARDGAARIWAPRCLAPRPAGP